METAIGTSLWLASSRRDTLGGRVIAAIGAALVIHATWYLATGTWHGYGDGVQLHRELGEAKWIVAVPAGAVACAAAYVGARGVLGALAATVPGTRRGWLAGTIAAISRSPAGSRPPPRSARSRCGATTRTRGSCGRSATGRLRELARWAALQAELGVRPTEQARVEMEHELDQHPTFPFAWLLGACTLASIIAGAARSTRAGGGGVPARLLLRAAVCAGGLIAAVIALDLALA